MATQLAASLTSLLPIHPSYSSLNPRKTEFTQLIFRSNPGSIFENPRRTKLYVESSDKQTQNILRTCRNCKTRFDPLLNHPQACRHHTAHFGGETRRKFESVYTGGTMNTPDSGKVLEYWHCCGSEDAFDPGCTAAPHSSYDD